MEQAKLKKTCWIICCKEFQLDLRPDHCILQLDVRQPSMCQVGSGSQNGMGLIKTAREEGKRLEIHRQWETKISFSVSPVTGSSLLKDSSSLKLSPAQGPLESIPLPKCKLS